MWSIRAIRACALGSLLGLSLSACGNHDHPPPPSANIGRGGHTSMPDSGGGIVLDGAISDGPPTCGGQTLNAIVHPPLLYFVIDRSGSMGEPIDEVGTKKYVAAQIAIANLLDVIGSRVRYGAAIYPATDIDSSCQPGFQLFPPTLGDAPSKVPPNGRGPILRELLNRLASYKPGGATPTSATLTTLGPVIQRYASEQAEPTFIVLVTDGAPNCNTLARCTPSECIPDIESAITQQGSLCGRDVSCCDTSEDPNAGANCIDGAATAAVLGSLSKQSIQTFVVGMPGSEIYARTLDNLALAGGTARASSPRYYAVSDADALSGALLEIGTSIAISCDIELSEAPADSALVNVYFDGELVPRDAENGWDYNSNAGMTLLGDACRTLTSGGVREVQIAYGCQTIVR